jgi:hypothetical protein
MKNGKLFLNRAFARFFWIVLFLVFFSSCIEDDFTNISGDDSLNWTPDISVPIGEGDIKANHYFNAYSIPDSFPVDSFPVYYLDSLYYVPNVQIADTFHLNFSMDQFSERREDIVYLSIRLAIRNRYPTNAEGQVYLYNGPQLLDSLFNQKLKIDPGKVNDENRVVEPSYKQTDVYCDSTKIDNLYRADHAVVYGAIYVTNENLEQIRFYEEYSVNIQMGLQGELRVEPSDF